MGCFVSHLRSFNFSELRVGCGVVAGSLTSAAVPLVCMPTGRKGERAERFFSLTLPLFSFHGSGEGGGEGFRRLSTLSGSANSMHASGWRG